MGHQSLTVSNSIVQVMSRPISSSVFAGLLFEIHQHGLIGGWLPSVPHKQHRSHGLPRFVGVKACAIG